MIVDSAELAAPSAMQTEHLHARRTDGPFSKRRPLPRMPSFALLPMLQVCQVCLRRQEAIDDDPQSLNLQGNSLQSLSHHVG
mmetsp:Transcript_10312/g.27382  ORF Transcript_10312/g.27382 Transcript_10312/m.27382 type:complete len:82 (-) Transcript_10312:1375-1620(-)